MAGSKVHNGAQERVAEGKPHSPPHGTAATVVAAALDVVTGGAAGFLNHVSKENSAAAKGAANAARQKGGK